MLAAMRKGASVIFPQCSTGGAQRRLCRADRRDVPARCPWDESVPVSNKKPRTEKLARGGKTYPTPRRKCRG